MCVLQPLECGNIHLVQAAYGMTAVLRTIKNLENNLARDSDLYTVNTVNNTMWTMCTVTLI